MFGPTDGDKVRLADTELFVEVEEDRTSISSAWLEGSGDRHAPSWRPVPE